MTIIVNDILKKYGDTTALDQISISINSGELIALLGPSGSGKTTLLRIIAGLEPYDSGTILIDNLTVASKPIREREIGFVFQHYALFKHMTVFDNVAFGLRIRPKKIRLSEDAIKEKVMSLLELVRIDHLHNRYPNQLSGGQKQRVAIARALAIDPKILLLDEPFGALDAKVRKELRSWMRRLHNEINITTIFVTHDQEEALEVADRVVILNNGRIEQIGTPAEVYHHPANSFVYDFLGDFNEFSGWKDDHGQIHIAEYEGDKSNKSIYLKRQPSWWVRNNLIKGVIHKLLPIKKLPSNDPLIIRKEVTQIFARPHDMELVRIPDDPQYIPVKLIHFNPAGSLVKMELEREDGTIIFAELTQGDFFILAPKKGETLYTRPKEMVVFG